MKSLNESYSIVYLIRSLCAFTFNVNAYQISEFRFIGVEKKDVLILRKTYLRYSTV